MFIKFKYDKNGSKRAYRFGKPGRWFPIKMSKAELMLANGKATLTGADVL